MTAEPTIVPPDEAPPEEPEEQHGRTDLTIMEHLLELRNRVIVCALAVVIGVIACAFFWSEILDFLLEPARTNPDVGGDDFRLNSFSPTDRIVAIFKIALYGGILVASPVIVYQILAFTVPGLTAGERKVLLTGIIGAGIFLFGGMAFAYYIILPQSLEFLLGLAEDQIQNTIGIKQYSDFVIRIVFWVGISFELPMIIALAARIGLVRAGQLIRFWRYAIILVFVIAAVVTPTPDPLTQSLVAVPLMGLYLIGILFAWILYTPRLESPA